MNPIFCDHIATTPLDPRVLEAMMPFLTETFGNPASQFYSQGRAAAQALEEARARVAALVGAPSGGVIFTSGATEANNLAIKGLARSHRSGHLVVGGVEHFSVLSPLDRLRNSGFQVTLVPVDTDGLIDPVAIEETLRPDTVLVSVQAANPEIGTLQPIRAIGSVCRARGVPFHTDATAAAGWVPLDMEADLVDGITLSGHNLYGPKGTGALVIRPGLSLRAQLQGGFQERGLRSGTENVPGIVGFGRAAELARSEFSERREHLARLGKMLWTGLEARVKHLHFTGHSELRLPGHVSFWVEFAEGESILMMLSLLGIMAASGSACASNIKAKDEDELEASHVLTAIGVPDDICAGSISMSLGKDNTESEVERILEVLPGIIQRLWDMSPAYADYLKEKKEEGSHE